ncbi:MAG: GNAT family protein [Pseudomonadota bacterium]
MVTFFSPSARESQGIETDRTVLEAPQMAHYEDWAHLRDQSRDFLVPWEPTWPSDDLTRNAFRRRVKRYQRGEHSNGLAFMIVSKQSGALLGGITVSRMLRGVAQSCAIGYWIGEPYARQGFMSEAVRGLLPEIFDELGFHRVEAACLPKNTASMGLLEKVGFKREGYAREYLKINGSWQDHVLYAMLESDYKALKKTANP